MYEENKVAALVNHVFREIVMIFRKQNESGFDNRWRGGQMHSRDVAGSITTEGHCIICKDILLRVGTIIPVVSENNAT